MFTGIVKAIGRIRSMDRHEGGARLVIEAPGLEIGGPEVGGMETGDSVAVSGVCLTVLDLEPDAFAADVSNETLSLTNLGSRKPGDPVNLEPALAAGQALGGHLVSGHVDGLAVLRSRTPDGDSVRLILEVPVNLARYIARKGSVTLDGVSLTVNGVDGNRFEVNLIPHTLEATTLGRIRDNEALNLEVDLVARYLERLLEAKDWRPETEP